MSSEQKNSNKAQSVSELSKIIDLFNKNATAIIWSADKTFKLTYINDYITRLTGFAPSECVNSQLQDLLSSNSSRFINNLIIYYSSSKYDEKKKTTGKYEIEINRKEGNSFWAEISISPEFNNQNKLTGFSGTISDISDRKNIEEALNISYGVSYTVFDNINAVVYVADMQTYDVIFTNSYTEQIFGNILGKKCWQVLRSDQDGPCELCPNKRLVDKNGDPKGIYEWEYNNNFNNRWYQAYDQAIKWIDDRVVRFEIAYDITERKKDERTLFKFLSQQKLFSKVAYGLNKVDDFQTRINNTLKILGQSDTRRVFISELENGKLVNSYFCCKKGDKRNQLVEFNEEVTDKVIWMMEKKGILKTDGTIISKEIIKIMEPYKAKSFLIVPIVVDEKVHGILGYAESEKRKWHELEITELKTISNIISNAYKRHAVEEMILESEKQLKIANATKDKFFSIIAHDLKNPFNTIIGFAELIIRNFENYEREKIYKMTNFIFSSAKNVYNLLENLLMWARTQTKNIKYNPDFQNINTIVEENVVLAQQSAQKKNIAISSELFYEGSIYGDYYMISTVIRNLISNAIKFTPENGKIVVTIKKSGEFAEISIEDTGLGMSKENIDNLFHIDKTFSKTGTDGETGSGLGLILCKEFIKLNGGEISIQSEINIGSIFSFTIPRREIHDKQ